jgi:hypothetical protein
MLALSPTATEFPISAEKPGVIVQVRSPSVIELELTAVTTPVSRDEGVPVAVALVVPVMPLPEDDAVADEEELDVEEDCDDETEETDAVDEEDEDEVTEPGLPGAPETIVDPGLPEAPDDELPGENEACLITFNTPCRQRIAAICPEENPEIGTRGSSRQAR